MTSIIIVNYNNWIDTIVCVESILRLLEGTYKIVIVDNASTDNSAKEIASYLKGSHESIISTHFPKWLTDLQSSEKKKYSYQGVAYTEQFGFNEKIETKKDIFFVKSSTNKGFSSGNNIGIKLGLLCDEVEYFWLLNNDAVVQKDSLRNLILFFNEDNYGFIGSWIKDFTPEKGNQAFCMSFNFKTAKYKTFETPLNTQNVNLVIPIGASMFTNRGVIDKVGLFDEDYFLYHEELEFSTRVSKAGFKTGVTNKSIIYHKQGATTGSKKKKKKNIKIERYKLRGLLLFYGKHYPQYKKIAYFRLVLNSLKRLMKGRIEEFLLVIRVIIMGK
jgi:hypothetical protein